MRSREGAGRDMTAYRTPGFTTGGVSALLPARTGPKGPSKLTPALAARIVQLHAAGLTLSRITGRTGVRAPVRPGH